jgi:tetratricopeptide (TPR) repeat protein
MKRIGLICTSALVLMLVLTSCASMDNEKSKKEAAAYRRVGEAYLQQGNIPAAMQELKKAEAKYPDDHLLQYDLGLIYYSRGRFDEAIGHYKKAVELKPDYGPAINSLGNAYAGKKDWDKAIFYYNQSIGNILYATPHFTYAGLGNAYYYKGELEQSEKYYLEALKIKPEFVNALQGLAQTYIAMGRIPEAVEKLEKAVRNVPGSPALHLQLAKAYRLALEFRKAYNSYRKVVELAPESQLADEAEQGAREVKKLF